MRHRGLAAVVASALLFTACSSDDATSSPSTAASAPSTTASASTAAVTDAPTTTAPVTTTEPATTEPATTEPATTEPATTEPATTDAATTEPAPADSVAADPATTTAAPVDPLDDLDEDGTRDATCGTIDLGGGLVVDTLCDASLVPTPENGVVPTAASLLRLPIPPRWDDVADVDATVRVASTPDGGHAVIYVLGSDTLFDSGKATVRSTASAPLDAIVASITNRFPGARIEVRGAADSVGEPAANQTLSEQRAAAIAAQLAGRGLPADHITSIGLGESVPVAEETDASGAVSEIGRQVNRRVEIVVRVAS